jgi:uncharacterized protein
MVGWIEAGPLIDVHCHLGQYAHGAMSADGETLCRLLQKASITHAIAFSMEGCYGGIEFGNRYTLTEASRQEMLSVMVVAHPHHLSESARWVGQAHHNPKIVGVKLHPVLGDYDILSGAVFRLIDEVIAPSGLPVLSHVGNESPNVTIDKYLQLAGRFPKVRFIAAHLGVGTQGLREAAVDAWTREPRANVWFDMATLRSFHNGAVAGFVEVVGPDRLCFGTDSPLYAAGPFVQVLRDLEVSQEALEMISYKNALTIFPALAGRPGVPRSAVAHG